MSLRNRDTMRRIAGLTMVALLLGQLFPVASAASEEALSAARQALKEADFDQAIELLRTALETDTGDVELRRELYLQLINTYWQSSNFQRDNSQMHTASELLRREAETTIRNCLSEPALRDTQMEGPRFPQSLHQTFDTIRGEMFGELRLTLVDPEQATVILDADTMSVDTADGPVRIENLPVGDHVLSATAKGRKPYEESLRIEPSLALEREISLGKQHGFWWYATIGAGVAAAAVVVAVVSGGEESSTPPQEPLGDPPPPPSGKR